MLPSHYPVAPPCKLPIVESSLDDFGVSETRALRSARWARSIRTLERLSVHTSPSVRKRVAGRSMLPADVVHRLRDDPDSCVRSACALRVQATNSPHGDGGPDSFSAFALRGK